MKMTGAQIVIECLVEQGVDTIFGYPGGTVLNIYDSLYQNCERIKHILTAHEQGAAHAADGYARATGRTGVVIATSGPGSTNLVTGIATAYMDSVPMVAITGNVATPLLGRDSFQEVDITGITMPITKHNYIVRDINQLADTLRSAFVIARSGRPGPVLVDIPKDITAMLTEYTPVAPKPIKRRGNYINSDALQKAANMILASQKPLIYAGGGVISSGATDVLAEFAELTDTPVCCSVMGLGGFPSDNSHYVGMIGMHGNYQSGRAASECDLIIAIGSRFSDRVAGNRKLFAPKAQIIHIDVDAAEIDKNVITHHHIIGDIKLVLEGLNSIITQSKHDKWSEQIKKWESDIAKVTDNTENENCRACKPKPDAIIRALQTMTDEDTIIVTDVGQHQMWTAQHYKFRKPRTFITSGGLGTMGFGLGGAIGASIAKPGKRVVLITGDGSFHMNCNELVTAVSYKIPVIIILMNNMVLGMVRQWQKMFYENRFSCTSPERKTDFVKLAEAYGAAGLCITGQEQIETTLKEAFNVDGPVVIDCQISSDDNVLPMIPPGLSIDQIVTSM